MRLNYVVDETVARVGGPKQIKRKCNRCSYKEIGTFVSSINWGRVLNDDDGESRYTVFCRWYQYREDVWLPDRGPQEYYE